MRKSRAGIYDTEQHFESHAYLELNIQIHVDGCQSFQSGVTVKDTNKENSILSPIDKSKSEKCTYSPPNGYVRAGNEMETCPKCVPPFQS